MTSFLGKLEAQEQAEILEQEVRVEKLRKDSENASRLQNIDPAYGYTSTYKPFSGQTIYNPKVDTQKVASNKTNVQTEQDLISQNAFLQDPGLTNGNIGTTPGSTANTGNTQDLPPIENPLHDYAPYNYIITLSCLSKTQFNQGEYEGIVIARSGGKGTTGASPLDKDFYINNLVVRNTITPTAQAGTGTVFQVLFDVTEPYGVSFIDALIQAADAQDYANHLKAVYNLKIEFRGINDDGQPTDVIPFSTRNIPIHIYQAEMQIDAGVSVYQISAVPATMLGLTEVHGKTKEAYTIYGDTVQEVLTNFFDAMNNTQSTLEAQNKILHADEYTIDVEQSTALIKTKLGYDELSDANSILNYSNVKISPVEAKRAINIPKGTSIQAFIEAVIRESDFYKDQFTDDMQPVSDDMTIARVFTQLEIVQDDNGNNRPSYRFVYIVREQKVTSAYFNKQGGDLVSDRSPAKIYNYIYTGQNRDVLAFDITYKFGYYQAIPYVENNDNDPQTNNKSGTKSEVNAETSQQGAGNKGVSQVTTEPEDSLYKGGLNLSVNKKNGEIGRIFEQIISDPSADLLVTTLEIIGDPYWIAQKPVTNKTFTESHVESAPYTDELGAVSPDGREVLIDFNFKTPTDLDDDTGIFFNNQRVTFSGKYKVYMCASRFADGMFTNELEMVRMRFQEDDEPEVVANNQGASKAGLQNKQGVGRYDPTKPAFLTDLGSNAGDIGVQGDNTGDNVTKIPVGSNITRQYTGANRGGFVPEGFNATVPPRIDITLGDQFYPKAQLDLIREIGATPDPSRIRPDGN